MKQTLEMQYKRRSTQTWNSRQKCPTKVGAHKYETDARNALLFFFFKPIFVGHLFRNMNPSITIYFKPFDLSFTFIYITAVVQSIFFIFFIWELKLSRNQFFLFLVELRQTEPFGWRTPLGEETAIPVVCFFIVGSEICFHKYRKHRLTFYIFIGHCTASCSWTVHGDMFTLCVTCGSNMLKSAGVAWWGKRRENNWDCDFIMNWFNVFTTSYVNE